MRDLPSAADEKCLDPSSVLRPNGRGKAGCRREFAHLCRLYEPPTLSQQAAAEGKSPHSPFVKTKPQDPLPGATCQVSLQNIHDLYVVLRHQSFVIFNFLLANMRTSVGHQVFPDLLSRAAWVLKHGKGQIPVIFKALGFQNCLLLQDDLCRTDISRAENIWGAQGQGTMAEHGLSGHSQRWWPPGAVAERVALDKVRLIPHCTSPTCDSGSRLT